MNFRRRKSVPLVSRQIARALCTFLLAAGPIACGHEAVASPATAATGGSGGSLDPSDEEQDDLITTPANPAPFFVHTYEGSGQSVHPDVYVFPTPWHGRRYWYAATPYPLGNSSVENPSIFLNLTSQGWDAPMGLANPLALPDIGSYLSDPDLQYDPAHDELRLYYREYDGSVDRIHLLASGDGTHWGEHRVVLQGARYSIISPAVVRETDGLWRLWAVDAENAGCRGAQSELHVTQRSSADGIDWDAPSPVRMEIPHYVPWHLDVQYVPAKQEYWALVAAYPSGMTCSATAVFFGRSTDGTTWRMSPSPLLGPGAVDALKALVYRSTFHYHPASDMVTVWFSGARLDNGSYIYAEASARYSAADLLRRVEQPYDRGVSLSRVGSETETPGLAAARAAFEQRFP